MAEERLHYDALIDARGLSCPMPLVKARQALQVLSSGATVCVLATDPAAERARFQRGPADILITTPESLYLMLTSAARETLVGVESVIVDEIHAVAATKRGGEVARIKPDPIDEMVKGQRCAVRCTLQQFANIIADAGQPLQPAFLVQELPHGSRTHPLFAQQIEHHTRIDLSRPGSHRQAIERSKAHRAFDTPPFRDGAHRSAAAEVRDDDATISTIRHRVAQALRDILIGKAVKAVAADPLDVELLRNRVMVGNIAMAAMECSVETGDLRHIRKALEQDSDRCQIVRLVQRRERHIAFKVGQHLLVHEHGLVVIRAAMNDAMTDRDKCQTPFAL